MTEWWNLPLLTHFPPEVDTLRIAPSCDMHEHTRTRKLINQPTSSNRRSQNVARKPLDIQKLTLTTWRSALRLYFLPTLVLHVFFIIKGALYVRRGGQEWIVSSAAQTCWMAVIRINLQQTSPKLFRNEMPVNQLELKPIVFYFVIINSQDQHRVMIYYYWLVSEGLNNVIR